MEEEHLSEVTYLRCDAVVSRGVPPERLCRADALIFGFSSAGGWTMRVSAAVSGAFLSEVLGLHREVP